MKKLIAIIIIPVLLFTGSCKKYLECETCLTDPNNPSITTPALLLAVGEVSTFASYEGQLARMAGVFTQHLAGTDFQFIAFARYNINDNDVDNEWFQIYTDCLINLKLLVDEFGEENPWYRGMAKVLIAMNLGILTTSWGDIPWSQALQGIENLNPAYDSQESVYQAIQDLLTDAIADFGKPAGENQLFPGTDDFMFGGDTDAWRRVAWVLKARYANHLSKRNPSGSASDAISFLNSAYADGFASPADDAKTIHGTAGNELNQWFSFNNSRGGYLKMGENLVNQLIGTNDPRLQFYADTDEDGGYSGTPIGSTDVTTSNVGPYYASPTSSIPLVSYVEAKFIEAEAKLRGNDPDGAATAHNEAVSTHIAQVTGSSDPAFEAANANETAGTITLEKIMTQKYVAMFLQQESWTDWRRTNIPALTPDPRAVTPNKEIPRRLVSPQTENVNNRNSPKVTNLELPVWWDQ